MTPLRGVGKARVPRDRVIAYIGDDLAAAGLEDCQFCGGVVLPGGAKHCLPPRDRNRCVQCWACATGTPSQRVDPAEWLAFIPLDGVCGYVRHVIAPRGPVSVPAGAPTCEYCSEAVPEASRDAYRVVCALCPSERADLLTSKRRKPSRPERLCSQCNEAPIQTGQRKCTGCKDGNRLEATKRRVRKHRREKNVSM